MRHNADLLLQRLDLGCCSDCSHVHQREAASLRAMAAWHEQWELISTLRLQALEQGHPYPPLALPYLDVQPFLPEGLPEDFPPSIDRCAACQKRLDEVRMLDVRPCGLGQAAGLQRQQLGTGARAGLAQRRQRFHRPCCCLQSLPAPAAARWPYLTASRVCCRLALPPQYLYLERRLRAAEDSEP